MLRDGGMAVPKNKDCIYAVRQLEGDGIQQ